jgi:hypothetical protein
MAANTAPIFPLTPKFGASGNIITTAITTVNGDISSGDLVMTAGSNGARVDYVRVRALGTNVATVLRLFINNGSTAATGTNNFLFTEATIAATTLSQVAALAETTVQLDLALPAGYKIYALIGTSVSAGLQVTAVYGDY